jgi:hypothetical protein
MDRTKKGKASEAGVDFTTHSTTNPRNYQNY